VSFHKGLEWPELPAEPSLSRDEGRTSCIQKA
jgi:hypothetical protein